MASQMGFLLDQKWCIGCQSCVTGCQMRHRTPDEVQLRKATSFEQHYRGLQPLRRSGLRQRVPHGCYGEAR